MNENSLLQILITDKEGIESIATEPFHDNTAWISITDFDMEYEFPTLKHNPKWILKLRFDDIVIDSDGLQVITDSQAETIAKFVKSILGKAKTLICQCEYGQSRSPAIAAAISEFLYQNGIWIFADEQYFPNRTVFHKVLGALRKNEIHIERK